MCPSRISLDEDDLRAILDGMVDGVITINDKGKILSFNKTAEAMFGYSNAEAVGKNVSMLMPDPDSKNHDSYLNRYTEHGDPHIIGIGRNVTALRKNGELFPMRLSVIEYPAKIEGERWFIGSCLDITLQKQQEDQLRQSMKMEALGKLTGGISHDYNNMLGIVLGYAGLLIKRFSDEPVVLEYAKEIKRAGERGKDLTKRLLTFARAQPMSEESTDVNQVLHDGSKMLEKMLTVQIKLKLRLAEDLWPVFIDKGCLEDAVLNISINAMHAMPDGGELELSTSNVEMGTIDSQLLHINKGDYVRLSITDTGCGMTEEVKQQIFEPFFTTKEDKGTGLGLCQVYGFVNNAGGTIRVYSEKGHGSCFSLYLPRHIPKADVVESRAEQAEDQQRTITTGNILIVDDEESLLDINDEILSSEGYRVIRAQNAEQALEVLEKEPVDLVLSDVVMPGKSGFELADEISNKYPNIKIQLCSGFPERYGKSITNKELYKHILQKPFTSGQLLQRVDKLLKE